MTILYIILSALLGLVIGECSAKYFNDRYLMLKSKKLGRTAICVQGKFFYYIVPEEEYVELDLLRLSRDQNKKSKGCSEGV